MAKGPKARLSIGQQRLVKELAKGGRIQDAGRRAGFSCPQATSQALSGIREKAPEILDRIGLPLEIGLKKYLLPLLKAKETVFFQNQGIVTDKRDVVALDIRMRATENLLKIHGAYPRGTNGNEGAGIPDNLSIAIFNLGPDAIRTISELVENRSAGAGEAEGRTLPARTIDVAAGVQRVSRSSKDPG